MDNSTRNFNPINGHAKKAAADAPLPVSPRPPVLSTDTSQHATPTPPRARSPAYNFELIDEDPSAPPPNPFSSIYASRHNPDFRVRNQAKMNKAADIISSLSIHLNAAHRANDQDALDAMIIRISSAGKGLDPLPQRAVATERGVRPREDNKEDDEKEDEQYEDPTEIMSVNRAGEFYTVQHEESGAKGETEEARKERVVQARALYELGLTVKEAERKIAEEKMAIE